MHLDFAMADATADRLCVEHGAMHLQEDARSVARLALFCTAETAGALSESTSLARLANANITAAVLELVAEDQRGGMTGSVEQIEMTEDLDHCDGSREASD